MTARILPDIATNVLKAADDHRATIPAALRKRIEQQIQLIDDASSIDLGSVSVGEALADAITEGRDPLTDPAVQRAALAKQLSNMTAFEGLSNAARDRLTATLRENIDQLVTVFQKPYADAGQALTDAYATLTAAGIHDLASPDIQRASLEVAAANVTARTAITALEQIDLSIGQLIYALGLSNAARTGKTHARFDTGDLSRAEVEAGQTTRTKVTHWEGVRRGYTISLATPAETEERVEKANAAQTRADLSSQESDQAAMGSAYRFKTPSAAGSLA
ncbi:hypothetical protein [Agrococcus sp. ProA11]|uniref:hypothetical protein n=1 Tax=Agrococcus chionoecetis TaxID=3153752 RepID=UPI0032617C39